MNHEYNADSKNRVRKSLPKSKTITNKAQLWASKGGGPASDPTGITRIACITYKGCINNAEA